MTAVTIWLAAGAALMLIAYLVRRPPLSRAVKAWLFFALGVLPFGTALAGNVAGFQLTQKREFCGTCHSMKPYTQDAADGESLTLASYHSRNEAFGDKACYSCHRDYGLIGTALTKVTGLRHLWAYYRRDPGEPIHLYRPYRNESCTYCHSTELPGWREQPEHEAVAEELAKGTMSCVGSGCHPPPHPGGAAP